MSKMFESCRKLLLTVDPVEKYVDIRRKLLKLLNKGQRAKKYTKASNNGSRNHGSASHKGAGKKPATKAARFRALGRDPNCHCRWQSLAKHPQWLE